MSMKKLCTIDYILLSEGRICFTRSSLVFVVNEELSTPLLKLQNELSKRGLLHLRVYCLICAKPLLPFIMNFHQQNWKFMLSEEFA